MIDRLKVGRCRNGNSLAAIKLVSAARGKNLELTTQQILSHPVLEEMDCPPPAALAQLTHLFRGRLMIDRLKVGRCRNGKVGLDS
jgi:hypothetical protein